MQRTSSALFCLVIVSALFVACSSPPSGNAAQAPAATTSPAAPPAAATPPGDVETLTGTVAETVDASTYTYVRVKAGAREIWAASDHFDVAVGDTIVVPLETPMNDFHSTTLNRDFPLIYFTSHIGRPGQPTPPALSASHGQGGPGANAPATPLPSVTQPIPPPPGGTTVADVWANRKTLAGKTVVVRGKVVKVNPEIMGRNWVHIQDGTGTAAGGTNDLTITTDAVVNVGDVVTMKGTVAVDKDFTAGYKYPVIVEHGSVVR